MPNWQLGSLGAFFRRRSCGGAFAKRVSHVFHFGIWVRFEISDGHQTAFFVESSREPMSIRRFGSRLVVPTTFVQCVIRWIGGLISHVNLALGFARWSSAWLFPRKRSHGRVAEEQVSLPPPPSSNRTDGFPVSGFTVLSRYKAIHRGVNKGSHKGRRPRRCSLA
jgi:hypothetical protein